MSDRLARIAGLRDDERVRAIALKLHVCATNVYRWCCRHRCCPRCEALGAKKRYEVVVRRLGRLRGQPVFLLTLTVGSDRIREGHRVLVRNFCRLRRRQEWRAFLGGIGQIEVLPARGTRRRWNVHLHVVAWTRSWPLQADLQSGWRRLVAGEGLPGSAELKPVPRLFVKNLEPGRRRFCPAAQYATKRRLSEWLAYSDEVIADLAVGLAGLRLVISVGQARRPPRRTSPSNGTV